VNEQKIAGKVSWNGIGRCWSFNSNFHFLYMHQGSHKLFLPLHSFDFPCLIFGYIGEWVDNSRERDRKMGAAHVASWTQTCISHM